jgi:hypothetical protein
MKCRACWAEKAFVRPVTGWRSIVHRTCLLVPLKCHHCYHKFAVFWPLTLGKQLTPPVLRVAPGTATHAAPTRQVTAAGPGQSIRRQAA